MAIERTYVVPLRKGWLKAPRYKRTKKAVRTLRAFLVRHMKSEDVRLLPELNVSMWTHGIKNPPSRVKINVRKDDKGVVTAQLFGVPFEKAPKKDAKKEAKAPKVEEVKETPKVAETAEVKEPEAKEVKEPAKKVAKKVVKKEPAKTT